MITKVPEFEVQSEVYHYLYVKKIYKKEVWAFLERKPLSSNCFLDDIAVQNDLNVKRIFIVRKSSNSCQRTGSNLLKNHIEK